MSRLIDADKLKDNIIKCLKPLEPEEEMIDVDVALVSTLMEIDEQPTAFDVDKAEKKKKKRSTLAKPVGWTKSYEIVILNDAVEIVKGGGVE